MAGEAERCCNTFQWERLGEIVIGCLDLDWDLSSVYQARFSRKCFR